MTVLETGRGVGSAVAGMLLADHGADVTRWAPQGPPLPAQEPGVVVWHRGKQRVVPEVDTGADGDQAVLDALLAAADVCILGPGDPVFTDPPEVLARRHPRTVFLVMPAYGGATPWVGGAESSELLGAAMGLAMRQSSHHDGPVDAVHPHVAYVHGAWAATCAVAALVERTRSGHGQVVTVTGAHAALVTGTATYLIDPYADPVPAPAGPGGTNPLYTRYRCGDGTWLFLGGLTAKFQLNALAVLDLADLADDPRLGGQLDRIVLPGNREWVRDRIADRFRARPRAQWLELLEAVDCPAGPVAAPGEWLDHPQIRALGLRLELDDPELGRVVMPGLALELDGSPAAVRGLERERPPGSMAPAAPSDPAAALVPQRAGGPLAGVRVLDLGTVLAGPFTGCLLAELGADVVKVEPLEGDSFRTRGFVYNRGMRSLAVDLRAPGGRAAFRRLAATADVVIDNFRPGVVERLGIDHATLHGLNPDVVTFSLTGFGDRGPLAGRPGFDPILQAVSGMMAAQGGDGEPVFLTVAVNDIAAAVMGALASCLGLLHRLGGGGGQAIRSSLAAMSVFMQSGELVEFPGRAAVRRGGDDYRGPATGDRHHRTRDGWVRVQATPQQWESAAPEVERLLAGECATAEIVALLRCRGIAATAARRPAEVPSDPALRAAEAFQEHHRADGRPYLTPGRIAHFGRTPQSRRLTAPGLGEHTREVLTEAGLGPVEIDDLLAAGAVTTGEPFVVDELLAYR
ncbi:CoA transferase [Pseudonocardia sp. GCM10023141]|uniref:CoA transferase n=1 Tax=Pseudonocardia sp. GCM10023141 TaxID=3252653 RepID=UPI00361BA352